MYTDLHVLYSTSYSCQIVTKLDISRECFEKSSNIEFHENVSSRSRVVPCGQTDGHDEAKSLAAILRTRLTTDTTSPSN
jgi:hypothetical protein